MSPAGGSGPCVALSPGLPPGLMQSMRPASSAAQTMGAPTKNDRRRAVAIAVTPEAHGAPASAAANAPQQRTAPPVSSAQPEPSTDAATRVAGAGRGTGVSALTSPQATPPSECTTQS